MTPAANEGRTWSSLSGFQKLALTVAVAAVVATYLIDLGHTPVYFGGDEAHFAVIGRSLAIHGTNLAGDHWPVFVRLNDPAGPDEALPWGSTWYQPFMFYLVALALKVWPMSEAIVRLPMAMVGGLLNPLLMFAVGRRLFRHDGLAALGAAILVLSPPHLILSRQALDYVAPLPFVLAWFWCVLAYSDTGHQWLALAAGAVLGLGCYSYIASWGLMPGFLALSWLAFLSRGHRGLRASALSAAAFILTVVPALTWLWLHPQVLAETSLRYRAVEDGGTSLLTGSGFGLSRLAAMVSVYWSYFDPAFLFLVGGPSMTTSTGRVGVFLLPIAVALPLGLYGLLRSQDSAVRKLIVLAGLLAAPVPATLRGVGFMVQREMLLLPFAALLCVYGVDWLRRTVKWWRPAVAIALAMMAVQYAVFVNDYWTHYKRRSAFYYDPVTFTDVADVLMAADRTGRVPAIYFSDDLDDVGPKWRFYLEKAGRDDLLNRTRYVASEATPPDDARPGSLFVLYDKQLQLDRLMQGQWEQVATIADVDARPSAVIVRRREPQP